MSMGQAFLALLVFPGLLYAMPMAWLMMWIERRLRARLQGRLGPPFYQPCFDWLKLLAKRPAAATGLDGLLMAALPIVALAALLGALALLPVFPGASGPPGDLVLLVGLLELPPIAAVLTGYASRSPFGQLGANREALLSVAYNLPFLTALVALAAAAGSLQLATVALAAPWAVRLCAVAALALCLPIRLRLNPFSLADAEQEIYSGPTTEVSGATLAFWELVHGMEWVALTGLVACLALPVRSGIWLLDAALIATLSLVLVVLLTGVQAATARLKVPQAARFYAQGVLTVALAALLAATLSS